VKFSVNAKEACCAEGFVIVTYLLDVAPKRFLSVIDAAHKLTYRLGKTLLLITFPIVVLKGHRSTSIEVPFIRLMPYAQPTRAVELIHDTNQLCSLFGGQSKQLTPGHREELEGMEEMVRCGTNTGWLIVHISNARSINLEWTIGAIRCLEVWMLLKICRRQRLKDQSNSEEFRQGCRM
jgi:hypothetical protein